MGALLGYRHNSRWAIHIHCSDDWECGMTRLQTALTSLLAAIPAAAVTILGVVTLLNYSENVMKVIPLAAVLILTLLLTTSLALMPVFILLFRGGSHRPEQTAVVNPPAGGISSEDEGLTDGDDIVLDADVAQTDDAGALGSDEDSIPTDDYTIGEFGELDVDDNDQESPGNSGRRKR